MPNTLADGQLPSASAALLTCPTSVSIVDMTLGNTSASLTETVIITLTRLASGVARQIYHGTLAPSETTLLQGIPMTPGDILSGQTTDAATVDYVIGGGSGELRFSTFDSNGVPKSVSSGVSGNLTVGGRLSPNLLGFQNEPTDTFAATMTIDVTKSHHVIAGNHTTSAVCTLTPSAAGTKGDILILELQETAGTGTIVWTFASTFHPNGTLTTTTSQFSTISFISDGVRWVELCRTTSVA